MSVAFASFATAALMVVARSAAEMPVVTPIAASIDTVKLVENCASFLSTISGRFRVRQRSCVIGKHTKPRAWVTIKLMASGVTCSAAIIRSPSFSLSSSSIKITILPWRMSSIISCVVLNAMLCASCRVIFLKIRSRQEMPCQCLCFLARRLCRPTSVALNSAQ